MLTILLILSQCYRITYCSLFPVVNLDKLYFYSPPENDITFHFYQQSYSTPNITTTLVTQCSIKNLTLNTKLPTIIIIHGWTHGKDTPWVKEMVDVEQEYWNVFVVDWSKLSRVTYIEARIHNLVVAKQTAKFLRDLTDAQSYPLSNIHIVGHSMGAQIGASTAHMISLKNGGKIGRITGLDPAAPLYEWPHIESLDEVLDPTDATFVDVIHTNAKRIGMITPAGHVDYYPNGGQEQWGCKTWSCSHIRACEFFIASLRKPDLFKAFTIESLRRHNEKGERLVVYPMGIDASPRIPNGIYFLKVEDEYTRYLLIANPLKAKDRKFVLEEEKYNATNFMTLWEFDGVLKYTPLFYGWYSNSASGGYKVPLAYFMTGLVVYGYSFFATLRKMAENSRTSKQSEKDDECIFTWKVFTAWDYMIGNAETAHNRVASIIMGFKEALLEEAEKKKDTRNWRVTSIRVLVNIVVIALLALSMFIVVLVVKRSTEPEGDSTFWRKNEIAMVMSLITFVFPMIFEVLGLFEQYHPRKQLRLQLGRIMVLNLANLYSLIFALIDKIGDMTTELQTFKNITKILNESLSVSTMSPIDYTTTSCFCNETSAPLYSRNQLLDLPDLVSNITSIVITNLTSTFNESIESITNTSFFNISLTSLIHRVVQEKIISNVNVTINETNWSTLNFTEIEFNLADYLTSILFSLPDDDTNNSTIIKDDSNNVTDLISTTWDQFTSTILPYLNNTEVDLSRFDYDFSSSTIFDLTQPQEETTTEMSYCEMICLQSSIPAENVETGMNYTMKARFRNLCWETMFGQELISITVMDLIMTIVPALGMDFFRGIFVRVMNRCWCWDLEKKFPKYGDFKVAENILSLVNNQGIVWMGMFFCPGLVVFNVIKLYIMMYFKAWAVMTCNVPPEVIFRASRSNNFYYYLLLMMLFLCVLPVGYTIVWIKPSWHCGPFSKYQRIFHIFTKTIKDNVPEMFQRALDYIASPGIVIPLLVLLILIIYYLLSLTNSLREANEDLKVQLRRERTEERRKMFQLADRRRRGGSGESNELSNTPFNKWKKLLGNLPSGKSLDETPKEGEEDKIKDERFENKSKDFFSKLIKRALRKSSTSEDDQNDDGTDTEQHDSLPYDTAIKTPREMKPSFSWGATDFQNVARKALLLKKSKPEALQTEDTKHVQINEKTVTTDINKNTFTTTHVKNESSTSKKIIEPDNSEDNFNIKSKHVKRKLSDIKRTFPIKEESFKNEPSTSKEATKPPLTHKQDSESSIWSDGIPVITISKSESSENIIDELCNNEEGASDEIKDKDTETQKFKPKIRCVLKKQATIDEDTIRYYNEDLEKTQSMVNVIKSVAEEDLDEDSDKSTSEDTERRKGSTDTVFRSPRSD